MTSTSIDETIRQRAYALWEAEGRPDGRHDSHWQTAEAEVSAGSVFAEDVKPTAKKLSARGVKKSAEPKADTAKAAPVRARKAKLSEPEALDLAKTSLSDRDA